MKYGKFLSCSLFIVFIGYSICAAETNLVPCKIDPRTGEVLKKRTMIKIIKGWWSYCDKKSGEVIIKHTFEDAKDFSEGLARIKDGDYYGYIDETGKVVIEPKFKNAQSYFEDNIALVHAMIITGTEIEYKYGWIDKMGKEIIKPKYDLAQIFSDGLAMVAVEGKISFIDKTGNDVIKFDEDTSRIMWRSGAFNDVNLTEYSFSEGLAWIYFVSDTKISLNVINKKGEVVIKDVKASKFTQFSEGLSAIRVKGDMWAYIDKTGTMVIRPFSCEWAYSFSDEMAIIRKGSGCGYIDKTGKIVIEPERKFENCEDFKEWTALVYNPFKYYIIDKTGKILDEQEKKND